MARSAVSAAALSPGGCAERLRLRSHRAPRCWGQPPVQEAPRGGLQALADDAHAPLRADCLYAGSGHRTGVRGTGRGRYPRPVGEDPGQSAEPPSRGPRRPPIGGGFTWAHSWAHTVDAPHPHVRMRAGVVDVPPGRVGNPKARPQPSDTSATRRVPRAGGREGWRASPRGRRGWDREAWVGLIWPLTSSRRYWRYRNGNPPSGQHDVSGVPAVRSVSQDAGLPCHCNGNLVSDQHGMSGDELGTNRLEPRGNPAIPTKTRPQTNTKCPISVVKPGAAGRR